MFSTPRRRTAWLTALVAVASIAALALFYEQHRGSADDAVVEALSVRQTITETLSLLTDAETGQRGYLLTNDEASLVPYERARRTIPAQLDRLKRIVQSDAQQTAGAEQLRRLSEQKLDDLAHTIALARGGHTQQAIDIVRRGNGQRLMHAMRTEAERMFARGGVQLEARKQYAETQRHRLRFVLYSASLLFLAIAAGALWSASRGIAEASRANARLLKNEQALKALADDASDLILIIGPLGEAAYASPSCKHILGYSQAEMRALPPRALLPEPERKAARALATAIRRGDASGEPFVHRLMAKDGSYRWFETKYRLASNSPAGSLHLTSRDVTDRKAAEDALRAQTQRLESILENMQDAVVVLDAEREIVLANPAAALIARRTHGEVLPADWLDGLDARLADGGLITGENSPVSRALRGEGSQTVELLVTGQAGVPRVFSVTASPIVDGHTLAGCVCVCRDVTERRQAEKEVEESEHRLRVLSEASFEGVAISRAGVVVDVNAVFASWFGRTPSELIGESGFALFAPECQDYVRLKSSESGSWYEATMLRPDGTRFPVEVRGREATFRGTTVRIAVVRDVTERKRQEAELRLHAEQLKALSLGDELTGLLNRRGFMEHARQQLRGALRGGRSSSLFFVDLNGMKRINDTLGHEAGDRALVATAEILRAVFRDSDIVSRLGGDEFAVLAADCAAAHVPVVRQRLADALADFNRRPDAEFQLAMSVGAAVYEPSAQPNLERLMEEADAAMYREKRASKDSSYVARSA